MKPTIIAERDKNGVNAIKLIAELSETLREYTGQELCIEHFYSEKAREGHRICAEGDSRSEIDFHFLQMCFVHCLLGLGLENRKKIFHHLMMINWRNKYITAQHIAKFLMMLACMCTLKRGKASEAEWRSSESLKEALHLLTVKMYETILNFAHINNHFKSREPLHGDCGSYLYITIVAMKDTEVIDSSQFNAWEEKIKQLEECRVFTVPDVPPNHALMQRALTEMFGKRASNRTFN